MNARAVESNELEFGGIVSNEGVFFGKYQIVERIGQGGFGKVYKGWDPSLKRYVAVKTCSFVDPELRQRFVQEAELAANLHHQNIVTIYDFGEQNGEPYMVQEYLSGEDMDRKIARGDAIELRTRIAWLRAIADGLGFAHARGIVHRDVKPGNMRIQDDGQLRIMDFGIAKVMEAERQLTQVGMSVGTTSYLSPEQLRGLPVDQRADIFSFGVLAYELMTGRRPFAGDSVSAIFYRIAHTDPQPVVELNPDCPPILAATIARCLEKDRDARYAEFARVIPDLDAAVAEVEGPARSGSPPAPVGSPPAPIDETLPIDWGKVDTAEPMLPAGVAMRPQPDAPAPPEPARGPGWLRSPRVWGLAAATVAVALFGVLNVARWGQSATDGAAKQTANGTPPTLPPSPAAVDSPLSSGPEGPTASATADRSDGGAPDRSGGDPQPTPPVMKPAGQTVEDRPTTAGGGEAVAPAVPALNERRILVLIEGPQGAVAAAEAALEAGLLDRGYEVLDANAIDGVAGVAGANRLAAVARGQGAASLVIASLEADASPSVGNFFTGTASLSLKVYDARDGRLTASETVRVGSGGTPGKLGPTQEAAQSDAATAVGRMAGQAVARRIGAGTGGLP